MKYFYRGLISLLSIASILLSTVSCDLIDRLVGDLADNVTDGNTNNGTDDGGSGSNNSTGGEDDKTDGSDNRDPDKDDGENACDGFKVAEDVLGDDQDADFEALFNYANHISLELDIPDSELKKIQEDYEKYSAFGSKSPIYRKANLYVTIRTVSGEVIERVIGEVGVRMKGNTSRTNFYSDKDGMYNLVHFKLSFGETFDEEEYYGNESNVWASEDARDARKDRTFATLEKMDIRWNRNDDATFIREIYCYDIYRELGLLAPHTNLASVNIGDDHAGLFVINEPIDKIFLEKNLPKEAQDLVEFGFRLPAAFDNRPLKFEEFQEMTNQVIYVSATPADYELVQSEGIVVEQLIRPTGLLDPRVEVRKTEGRFYF